MTLDVSNFSFFILYSPRVTNAFLIELGPNAIASTGFYFWNNANSSSYLKGDAISSVTASSSAGIGNWQLVEIVTKDPANSSLHTIYTNCTLVGSGANTLTSTGASIISNTLYINGENDTNSYSYSEYIAEILIINKSVTTAERQLIEGEILNKWGLNSFIPSTHPYK